MDPETPKPAPPAEPAGMTGKVAQVLSDVRRLSGLVAKAGAILAVVCHLLPPEHRLPCDAVVHVCRFLTLSP